MIHSLKLGCFMYYVYLNVALFLNSVYPCWAAGELQTPMQQHPSYEHKEWEVNKEGHFMFLLLQIPIKDCC